jgi:uncharacterized protein YuzE
MHGTYDRTADAAYIYLVEEIRAGEAQRQVPVDGEGAPAMIVLDLDDQGRILGIEIVGARSALRPETIEMLRRLA